MMAASLLSFEFFLYLTEFMLEKIIVYKALLEVKDQHLGENIFMLNNIINFKKYLIIYNGLDLSKLLFPLLL